MASFFLWWVLRGFVAMSLLLPSHPVFREFAPCPKDHCSYLPLISNPPVVVINSIQLAARDKGLIRYAFGEVINQSNLPVYNVVVQVTFHYFENSGYDRSLTNTTFLTATLPGQANAFEVSSLARDVVLSDSKVVSWDITPTLSLANLTVVNSRAYTVSVEGQFGFPNFATIVTGTLRNDTSNTLKDVQVYVWNVTTTLSSRQVISQVSAGATAAVSATLFDSIGYYGPNPNDTIRIVAQGVISP
ncbi:MAG: hypothetical protein HC853_13715 [Anaerolineae bacterium]|nr:hypothetical protein [Anaerolineae bacterium]